MSNDVGVGFDADFLGEDLCVPVVLLEVGKLYAADMVTNVYSCHLGIRDYLRRELRIAQITFK